MEVKNNPFYELRTRLYATAAAGCSLIAEDFRLSRAVEAFKPMSEANKVFGKLYAMCNALLSSSDPAADIIDCIALADALAVTQGTFADSSETSPVPPNDILMPARLTYNELEEYKTLIRKAPYTEVEFDQRFYKVISDPRLLSVFREVAGRNGSGVAELLIQLGAVYGDRFYTLLFDSLDLTDKNSTGNQIRFISSVTHDRFNDRYVEYAQNDDAPQNIRIAAIDALAWSPDNEALLLDIYKTSKSKIKSAALLSLAKLSSPAVESVIGKAAAKPKNADFELFCLAGGKTAEDYVRSELEYLYDNSGKEIPETHPFLTYRFHTFSMLANKKNVTDVFEKWAARFTESENIPYSKGPMYVDINEPLKENLFRYDEPVYRDMIRTLHSKYPTVFSISAFCLALMEEPENACRRICTDHRLYDRDILHTLRHIFSTPDGWYRIRLGYCSGDGDYSSAKIFTSITDDILDFMTDSSVIYNRNTMERDFPNGKERDIAKENMEQRTNVFRHLLRICTEEDRERVSAAQEKFENAMNEKNKSEEKATEHKESPYGSAYTLLMDMASKDMPPEFAFMIERSTIPEDMKILGLKQALHDIEKDYPDSRDGFKANIRQILNKLGVKE